MSWPVLHVDLRSGVSPTSDADSPVFIVWWWGALPLGATSHLATELPFSHDRLRDFAGRFTARQLLARSAEFGGVPGAASDGDPAITLTLPAARGSVDFDALDRWAEPSAATAGDLCIVVCTRDRPEALRACLRALRSQRAPAAEIVVVDNSATLSARDVVAECTDVVYVHEPRPGLSFARNAGVARCTRPLLAFTDDDVEVDPGWTAELVAAFDSDPAVEAVCGLVVPATLDSEAQRYFQFDVGGLGGRYVPIRFDRRFLDATIALGPQVWRIGAGANMAFRRQVFDRIGLFDERLGAGAAGCSEDSELWYRILAAGGACLYEPRAVVRHHHRAEWPELLRQIHAYMKGHTAALLIQHAQHGHSGNLRRAFNQLPRHFVASGVRALFEPKARRTAVLMAEFKGWAAGVVFGLRARARRSA